MLGGFASHEARAQASASLTSARLACPSCGATLARAGVGETGVEVDACSEHGTWFDAGEIARITAVVAPGAAAQAAAATAASVDPSAALSALAAATKPRPAKDPWLVMAAIGASASALVHIGGMAGFNGGPLVLMLTMAMFVVFIVAVVTHPMVKRSGTTWNVSWRDGFRGTPLWLKIAMLLGFVYLLGLSATLDVEETTAITTAMTAAETAIVAAALGWAFVAAFGLRWSRAVLLGLRP
jgi:Zn-finger nucleic acid-binding protein